MPRQPGVWTGITSWAARRAHASSSRLKRADARGRPTEQQHVVAHRPHGDSDTYLFSLAQIRDRLGDRWEQYGPSVHRIARRMLSSSLADKGSFRQLDDTYVVKFDRLRGRHAVAAGQKLHEEFMALLAPRKGEDDPDKIARSPKAPAQAESRPGLIRRVCTWLKARFRRGGRDHPEIPVSEVPAPEEPAEASQPADAKAPTTVAHSRNPASGRHAGRRHPVASRKRMAAVGTGESKSEESPRRREKKSQDAVKLLREARKLEDAMAAALLRRSGFGESPDRTFPPPDLNFVYRSMWNLKSQHLTTYTSVPICWKNSLEICRGEDVVPLPRRPENLFELDLLCLENSLEVLEGLTKQARPVLFMTAIHAATLANETAVRKYLKRAESMSGRARDSLIFEIIDMADYANQLEGIRMVKALSSHARGVTVSIGLDDRNFAFWKRCGVMGAGVDLSRDARVEGEIVARFANFAAQAKRNRLISYLREVDTRSIAVAALSSGFDFLEGALIGSSDNPDTLVLSEFTLENLYIPEVVWVH